MTQETYERVARLYEGMFGEPLVASDDWVGPLYETVETAVACDPEFEGVRREAVTDFETEVATRTADVVAVITYGRKAVQP